MSGVAVGNRSVPSHAWQVEPVSEVAPALSTQALLSGVSKLLLDHADQVQAHQRKILQAIEDVKLSSGDRIDHGQKRFSVPRKPGWGEVDVVPLPDFMDESLLNPPEEEAPKFKEIADETSSFSNDTWANQDADKRASGDPNEDSPVKDQLPEFMRGRYSMIKSWRRTRRSVYPLQDSVIFSQTGAQNILSSKMAELVVTIAIFLNSLIIGIEADWTVKHSPEDTPEAFRVVNTTFTVIFTAELLFRIFAYRKRFFSPESKEFSWNLFDLLLVLCGIVDEVLALLISTPNFTVIRMLRVSRFVRVIRVFRVLRFFQDLRIIIFGIAGAVKSMLWAIGLLFMMMYLMSICLLQLTAVEIEEMNPDGRDRLLSYYGGLITAIYTLYQSITGGVDWAEAAKPLLDISPFLALVFSFYIAFAVLCVLNIITGVFVDNARNVCVADEEQLVIEGFENRVKWFEEVKKLFQKMVGGAGALDSEHFMKFLDDVQVQACFRRLGIDVHETSKNGLFQLLDFNQTGEVDLEEFALGLQSLHGSARAIDLARIHCEVKKLTKDVHSMCSLVRGGMSFPSEDAAASQQALRIFASASQKSTWLRTRTEYLQN